MTHNFVSLPLIPYGFSSWLLNGNSQCSTLIEITVIYVADMHGFKSFSEQRSRMAKGFGPDQYNILLVITHK